MTLIEDRIEGVYAVIVTYNPDLTALGRTIGALRHQILNVVVVDNGSSNGAALKRFCRDHSNVTLLQLSANRGVAAAQNVGIAVAREARASHVLLLDQDSVPGTHMVARLHAALQSPVGRGERIAAAGPRFRVGKMGATSRFSRLGLIGVRGIDCWNAQDIVPTDFLISSGMLISTKAIEAIGEMDEDLFIDHVDTEWCLRARFRGFRLFGVCSALLEHDLGEDALKVWFGRWRQVHRHKAFRYYYIFRNTVLLARRGYTPIRWMLFEIWRLLGLIAIFGLLGRGRGEHFKMMMKGLRDGLHGVAGRANLL